MRALWALILSALFAWPACAAIGTPTNLGTASSAGAVTALDITTGAAINVRDLVVVIFNRSAGGTSAAAVTDDAGNTYTRVLSCNYQTSAKSDIWYAIASHAMASTNKIHTTWTGSSNATLAAVSVTGVAQASPTGANVCGTGGSAATNSVASGTLTLANGSAILIGFLGTNGSITAYASNSPFTDMTGISATSAASMWGYDKVSVTTTVTYAPSWTTSRFNDVGVVEFDAAPALTCTLLLGMGSC